MDKHFQRRLRVLVYYKGDYKTYNLDEMQKILTDVEKQRVYQHIPHPRVCHETTVILLYITEK